ncbi:MAG TPA: dUTP diphosphatase [Oligoflexus sp.]|jgi:dUTP pyrophosphatase|uniref:dUTP diphosphatase n=1 Tax=Oligoflexus sp. TaxID=1971216 RepID=UPI002D7EA74F|nr:dUTP diphosphatase [Oligoflexus sp.]HET9236333.1 dUTP diphosphatase [Oligoflexus sp.]
MFQFRFHEECTPRYMTEHSAAADLVAREGLVIEPGTVACVPTGVWISEVEWSKVPTGFIPELQIRARSGLARKNAITLANGVGTIDADYREEIGVLLLNLGREPFTIQKGDRIAQMALNLVGRLELPVGGQRQGGFGSTSV